MHQLIERSNDLHLPKTPAETRRIRRSPINNTPVDSWMDDQTTTSSTCCNLRRVKSATSLTLATLWYQTHLAAY
jgi:hypothetical protein